jgi:uncharacterized linocin/CFP29 family protein
MENTSALENMAFGLGLQAYAWDYPVIIHEHRWLNIAGPEKIILYILRGSLNTLVHAQVLLTPEIEDVWSLSFLNF